MTRRTAWRFLVTRPNGITEIATFYGRSKDEAEKYAVAWTRRMGFEIQDAEEKAS